MATKQIERAIWIGFMLVYFIGLYFLNANISLSPSQEKIKGFRYEKASVLRVINEKITDDPNIENLKIGSQTIEIEILSGTHKGEITTIDNSFSRLYNTYAKKGTKLLISSNDDFETIYVSNYAKDNSLYLLIFIFLGIVVMIGKAKGLKSIFSLTFTLITVIYFFIPLILNGMPPIIAGVIVAILSTSVTLFSLNGWCKKTITAGVSCILCTVFAGIIGYTIGSLTHISSLNTEQAEQLIYISLDTSLKIKDLIFSGILIASLGAIMDTTMTISSSITELVEVNPTLKYGDLYKSAMNIGRDIMGTMTNTLILAFAGSSINILIMLYLYNMQYTQLINLDLLAIELIQGISASIAVVVSIPITAMIGAFLYARTKHQKHM